MNNSGGKGTNRLVSVFKVRVAGGYSWRMAVPYCNAGLPRRQYMTIYSNTNKENAKALINNSIKPFTLCVSVILARALLRY